MEFKLRREAIDKNIEARTPFKLASTKDADTVLTGEDRGYPAERADEPIRDESYSAGNGTDGGGELHLEGYAVGAGTGGTKEFLNRTSTEIPQIGRAGDGCVEQWAVERLAEAIVDQDAERLVSSANSNGSGKFTRKISGWGRRKTRLQVPVKFRVKRFRRTAV